MMVAWFALISWPLVGLAAFRLLSPPVALAVTVLGGYLLLPEKIGLDLPLLPRFDKFSIPALTAALAILMLGRRPDILPGWVPRDWRLLVCLTFLVLGSFGTAMTNLSPTFSGVFRPGLQPYDGISLAFTALITILPFLLARKVLATEEAHRTFLMCCVVAICGYAFLALYEVRMSPQLHIRFYGFFQDSWLQHMREGGFRPIVFLRHALWVGILLAVGVILALGLFRLHDRRFLLAALWCLLALVFSKTLGALLIVVVLGAVAFFLPLRAWRMAAIGCAGLLLLYPLLRSVDLVPVGGVIALAERIDPARAASFNTRLTNEDILLARASEKPIFGWGTFGRERVYDEETGHGGVSDGFWVITIGQGGWVRYLGFLGLLCFPIIVLGTSRAPPEIATVTALALAANLVDLVPNAGITPLTWLLAGGLSGLLERAGRGAALTEAVDVKAAPVRGAPVLRREFPERKPQDPPEDRKGAQRYSRTHETSETQPRKISRRSRFSE